MQLPTRFVGFTLAWVPVWASIRGDAVLPQQPDNRMLAVQLPAHGVQNFLGARPVQEQQPSRPVPYSTPYTLAGYPIGTGTEQQSSVFLAAPALLAPQPNRQLLQVPTYTEEVAIHSHVNPSVNGGGSNA